MLELYPVILDFNHSGKPPPTSIHLKCSFRLAMRIPLAKACRQSESEVIKATDLASTSGSVNLRICTKKWTSDLMSACTISSQLGQNCGPAPSSITIFSRYYAPLPSIVHLHSILVSNAFCLLTCTQMLSSNFSMFS
jgi:hypothetical protein